jgi:hypothetical protein
MTIEPETTVMSSVLNELRQRLARLESLAALEAEALAPSSQAHH